MWITFGFVVLALVVWLFANRLFPHTITWKEGALAIGVQSVAIITIVALSMYSQGYDTQIINGEVISKRSEHVSCSHSYSCRCRTTYSGSGSNRTSHRTCDTCYEHAYDVDWIVKSNVGLVEIDRVNRQGTQEPPRWTKVQVGDPFSREVSYYNYIKASPFSIFNRSALNAEVAVPDYPTIHDYYKINRVIDFGSKFKHDGKLNDLLNEQLKTLGPEKKVNLVVVLHSLGSGFPEALKTKHLGGKINDVYVVIGIDAEGKFYDVNVFSWSKADIVNIQIRDALLAVNNYEPERMVEAIAPFLKSSYIRRDIEEFKYLDNEVEIPQWALWLVIILGTLFPFGSAYWAHRNEFTSTRPIF